LAGTFSDNVNRCYLISYVSQELWKWQCYGRRIHAIIYIVRHILEPSQFLLAIVDDICR
jgi:hypothetical protein